MIKAEDPSCDSYGFLRRLQEQAEVAAAWEAKKAARKARQELYDRLIAWGPLSPQEQQQEAKDSPQIIVLPAESVRPRPRTIQIVPIEEPLEMIEMIEMTTPPSTPPLSDEPWEGRGMAPRRERVHREMMRRDARDRDARDEEGAGGEEMEIGHSSRLQDANGDFYYIFKRKGTGFGKTREIYIYLDRFEGSRGAILRSWLGSPLKMPDAPDSLGNLANREYPAELIEWGEWDRQIHLRDLLELLKHHAGRTTPVRSKENRAISGDGGVCEKA